MTTTLTRVLLTLSALISLATATETTLDRSESETKSESRNSGLGDGGSVSPSGKVSFKGLPRTLGQWVNLNASALNFNLPNINPQGSTPGTGATGTTGTGGLLESLFGGGSSNIGLPGTVGTVGASAVLIKGGFLTFLTAVKSIVVPAVLTLLLIAFLIAGAAFFTCSLVDCGGSLGSLTRGGGLSSILDDRNTIDYMDQFRPIYQAVDDGKQKYGTPLKGHGNSGPGSSSGR